MNQILSIGGLLAGLSAVIYFWRVSSIRERVRNRLVETQSSVSEAVQTERPFASRYRWVSWLVAGIIAAILIFLFSWPINISIGLALALGLLGMELEAWIYEWKLSRIESQLADAIDVLVASLTSGSSLQASLSQSAEYSPNPLRNELIEMVARLRLGDSPDDVFRLLSKRVPTETFQLLSTSLIVNWQVGGGLAETLSGVGKTIRDRMAISRQIRTLTTQGRLTTITVISVVWFMAAMMWQADPPRFVNFVVSDVGTWLISIALALQGVGIALVSKISRPKI